MLHLRLVFNALLKANLRIKLEKCLFFQKNVPLVGCVVGRDGRKIDPEKVKSISKYPRPTTFPQLSRFLGMSTSGTLYQTAPHSHRLFTL